MSPRGKGRLRFLALFVALILALGWWVFDGSTTWPRTYRYRLTLTVDTPEGERTGSSVVQVKTSFPGGLRRAVDGDFSSVKVTGEATVVDLGSRGLLFAVLKGDTAHGHGYDPSLAMIETLFPRREFRASPSNDEYYAYLDELVRRKPRGALEFKDLPLLVRFRDLKNPTSVERVDPLDLAASFGPGVALRSATVEITDDPVTMGIAARLTWLKSSQFAESLFPSTGRGGPVADFPQVELLNYDDFRRLLR